MNFRRDEGESLKIELTLLLSIVFASGAWFEHWDAFPFRTAEVGAESMTVDEVLVLISRPNSRLSALAVCWPVA